MRLISTPPTWLLPVCMLAACSSSPTASQPDHTDAAASTAVTPGSSIGLPEGFVLGPGEFQMANLTFGLDALTSYRASLTISFTGTVSGQSQSWSMTKVLLYSQAAAATQSTTGTIGTGAPDAPTQEWEVNGVAYTIAADSGCSATGTAGAASLRDRSEPAASLLGVVGAEETGTETVNGAQAEHATFDERALGLAGLTHSTGELWVAADAGYLVKYALAMEGNADYFGEGTEGTASWAYELTDANRPVAIDVPGACPAGRIDAPLVSGAESVVNEPGVITYQTSAGIADVVAFYQGRAAELGWILTDGPLTTDAVGVIEYSVADGALTIFAQAGGDSTKVFVTLERVAD
jgi:hypothetical protein